MIDQKRLRELVKLMKDNDLTELDMQDQAERVSLKRAVAGDTAMLAPVATHTPKPSQQLPHGPSDEPGLKPVTSPMVGTFYFSSSPEAEPLIKVGDTVDGDTVVCIIEAMKVFNEIKAEVSGKIEKVMVYNGQAVEFGEPLFMVRV